MMAHGTREVAATLGVAGRLFLHGPQAVLLDQPGNLLGDPGVRFDRRALTAGLAEQRWHQAPVGAVQPVMRVPVRMRPRLAGHGSRRCAVVLAVRIAAVIDLDGLLAVDYVGRGVTGDSRTFWVR